MRQAGLTFLLVLSTATPAVATAPVTPHSDRFDPGFELELPFQCGAQVVVSQSHGTFSHVGLDTWAWDFRVPVGTPVHAARFGTVRAVRADSTRGGCDRSFGPDANYVIIAHENGLETQYLHLDTVTVEVGQKVEAGELIGTVGKTGWVCGPHLHFQLQRTNPNRWANQSVPARFRRVGDPVVNQLVTSENCPAERPRVILADAKEEQADVVTAEPQSSETVKAALPPAESLPGAASEQVDL